VDLLASRYLNKLNTKPWNPAFSTIKNTLNNNNIWKPRSIPAAIPHLSKMRVNYEEGFSIIPSYNPWIEPIAPWNLFEIKTKLFPLSKKAATSNPQLTQEIFRKLMENEPTENLTIYTDGSCCELTNISSCAFYIPKLGEKRHGHCQYSQQASTLS
jgi:hypothetical protein